MADSSHFKFEDDSTYYVEGEDLNKLARIHGRLADESKPLNIDESRDLHLLFGLLLEKFIEEG